MRCAYRRLSERRAEPKVYANLQRERRRDLEALLPLRRRRQGARPRHTLRHLRRIALGGGGRARSLKTRRIPRSTCKPRIRRRCSAGRGICAARRWARTGRVYTLGFCRKPAGAYCNRWSPATTTCAPRRSTAPPSRRFYSLKMTASASFWRSSRFCAASTPPAPAPNASARLCRRDSRTPARLPTLRRSCAASAPEPPISRAMCRARLGWMRYSLPMCRRTGFYLRGRRCAPRTFRRGHLPPWLFCRRWGAARSGRGHPSRACAAFAHLYRRLLDASLRAELEEDFSPAPRLKHAALEDGRLMLARGAGFFCGLTSGGDRANVGDICLFLDRACVLSGGNLPLAQLPRPLADPLPIGIFPTPAAPSWAWTSRTPTPPTRRARPSAHADALPRGIRRAVGGRVRSQCSARPALRLPFPLRAGIFRRRRPFGADAALLGGQGPLLDARRLEASASFPEGQWEIALTYPEAVAAGDVHILHAPRLTRRISHFPDSCI